MNCEIKELIDRLEAQRKLDVEEYVLLVHNRTEETAAYLADRAAFARRSIYGTDVYIRGLIEVGNVCRNDCYYCGIRRSNGRCDRYRLTDAQIINCCREGYALGFRTFVLQGGEDAYFSAEKVSGLVHAVKREFPDCALTLSLGEYSREDYRRMREAGADRYLLRHETAVRSHYEKLHPSSMSYENRMRCLRDLKELGFQVGCGFMVGSPYQTERHIAEDLKFIETFSPDMCGIGPFIPQTDTPFGGMPAGTAELTVFLLSVIRLIQPNILLPATTALGTVAADGRVQGILAGANVVMPNLSPLSERKKYALYDRKAYGGLESAQNLAELKEKMNSFGYQIVTARGDIVQ